MKITVIGAGNMGGAIAAGAVRSGLVAPDDVMISNPGRRFVDSMKAEGYMLGYTCDNATSVEGAEMVIVAVKPWKMEEVLGQIAPKLDRQKQCVVSIAAGISFAKLEEYLANDRYGDVALYRVIPNTAIAIGLSVTFVSSHKSSAGQDADLKELFGKLGSVFDITEEEIYPYTALSSSGIAYAYKYLDAAAQGGVKMGVGQQRALRVVIDTMKSAVAMLEANRTMPQQEIDKVTTPGGITLKGLDAMEKNGFSRAVLEGLLATKFD